MRGGKRRWGGNAPLVPRSRRKKNENSGLEISRFLSRPHPPHFTFGQKDEVCQNAEKQMSKKKEELVSFYSWADFTCAGSQGDIDVTISQGKVVFEYGKLNVESGAGRYIAMEPYMSLYDGLEKVDAKLREEYKAPVDRTFKATT